MNIYQRMTKTEIIAEISEGKEWIATCRKIACGNDIYHDLYQEFLIVLLSMPNEKIEDLHQRGELRFYCVRILLNMYRGENSAFFKAYRRIPVLEPMEEPEYDPEVDRDIERVEAFLRELPDYEREIFQGYIRHGSYRKFAKEIEIGAPSLAATVNKVRRKFRQLDAA